MTATAKCPVGMCDGSGYQQVSLNGHRLPCVCLDTKADPFEEKRSSGLPDFKASLRTARAFVLAQGGTLAPESIVRNRSKE